MDTGGHTEEGSEVALAHLQSCVGSWIQNPPEHIQLLLLEFLLTVHHMYDVAATALACGLQQSTTGSSILLPGRREGHLGSERQAVPGGHSLGTAEQLPAAQPRTTVSPPSLKEGGTHWDMGFSSPHHPTPSGLPQAQTRWKGNKRGKQFVSNSPLFLFKKN